MARNRSGAAAMVFAVALMAILVSVGVAIDFGRAWLARSDLQARSDFAALSAALSTANTEPALLAEARKYLDTPDVRRWTTPDLPATLAFVGSSTDRFRLKVAGSIGTTFLAAIGRSEIDIGVISEVERGNPGNLELALVLDNTFSMTNVGSDGVSRLDALKVSAKDLIATLKADPAAKVKAAVVPFVDYVNVGLENRTAPWMSVPADRTETGPEICRKVQTYTYINCVKKTGTYDVDGVPQTYEYNDCDEIPGPIVDECSSDTTEYAWHGCVGTRPSPYELVPGADSERYPGLQNVWCAAAITPLTTSISTVRDAIDALYPTNETYIAPGVLWGVNVLSPDAPYTEAAPFTDMTEKKLRKVLVLMTDGTNTRSLNQPWHDAGDKADADDRTARSCAMAKTLGIEVFTIAFDVTDASTKALLQGCADDADHYFDAAGSAGIKAAFAKIARNLRVVRLTS